MYRSKLQQRYCLNEIFQQNCGLSWTVSCSLYIHFPQSQSLLSSTLWILLMVKDLVSYFYDLWHFSRSYFTSSSTGALKKMTLRDTTFYYTDSEIADGYFDHGVIQYSCIMHILNFIISPRNPIGSGKPIGRCVVEVSLSLHSWLPASTQRRVETSLQPCLYCLHSLCVVMPGWHIPCVIACFFFLLLQFYSWLGVPCPLETEGRILLLEAYLNWLHRFTRGGSTAAFIW